MLLSMDHPLKTARKRHGLNQAMAAELLGTTQATISKYESGEITPSIDVAAKIARELGMSELELLYPDRYGFERQQPDTQRPDQLRAA